MEKRKTTVVVECKLGANCKCATGENAQIAKCAQVVGLAGVEWDWGVAPLVSGRVARANLCPLLYLFTQPFIPANATRSINFDTFINQHFPSAFQPHQLLPPRQAEVDPWVGANPRFRAHASFLFVASFCRWSKRQQARQASARAPGATPEHQQENVGLLGFWWMQEAAEQR